MITKLRLSDNANLSDTSTHSNCEPVVVHAGDDTNSGEPSLGGMKSDDHSGGSTEDPQSIDNSKHQASSHKKPIPGLLASDDSCNAVDNKLREENEDLMERLMKAGCGDLSFNGKIKPLKIDSPEAGAVGSSATRATKTVVAMNCELIDATKGFEVADKEQASRRRAQKDKLNESLALLSNVNTSWILYKNEKSPDLFADDDDDDDGVGADEEDNGDHLQDQDEQEQNVVEPGTGVRRASGGRTSGGGLDELDFALDGVASSDTVERILLKRLQSSLSGVPPPPSLTYCNIDAESMLSLYRDNVQQWCVAMGTKMGRESDSVVQRGQETVHSTATHMQQCLSKPTHAIQQLATVEWPDLLKCRGHGLHYNKSTVTEKLELLGLKYVERYIGAETSSSFNLTRSPSSAKKRNQRRKMLGQSPGRRLSHLARRRSIFSSENLMNTSAGSGTSIGTICVGAGRGTMSQISSRDRLNPFRSCNNRQVLLDPKKSDNRRKNKVKTPQRRAAAAGLDGKSPRRRTPVLSAKKLSLARTATTTAITTSASASVKPSQHVPATLESSKRALFLSPPNGGSASAVGHAGGGSNSKQMDRSIFSEARMLKSKRSLFTTTTTSSGDCAAEKGAPTATVAPGGATKVVAASDATSLKRRRDEGEEDPLPSSGVSEERTGKIRRKESTGLGEEDLTPRSLKFARSQSFCVGAQIRSGAAASMESSTGAVIGGKSIFRAKSEMTADYGNRTATTILTENHKKKLLWAVSQALKDKQVPTKHEMFKQHASNLARLVKRLYIEFNDQTISSTSEKLLRLAHKHVFEVMQGKTVDDIYYREKTRIMNARNLTKLQGYIAPEEYQRRQLRRAGSMASVAVSSSIDCNASPFDGSLSASQNFLSQSSIYSQGGCSVGSSFSQLSEPASGVVGLAGRYLKTAASTGSVNTVGIGVASSTVGNMTSTALRENIDSELRQRSTQKQLSFSGKDQKNVSPYRMDKGGCPTVVASSHVSSTNNKLLVGGALNSSIMKAKRQISFE